MCQLSWGDGGERFLVLAMVKQNNRLHNKYIVVLAMVTFSKSPRHLNLHFPQWGGGGGDVERDGGFDAKFGASLSPHKMFFIPLSTESLSHRTGQ